MKNLNKNRFNKKINLIFLVFVFLHLSISHSASAQTPFAKISSIPSAIIDTLKICQGQGIIFSNNSDSTLSLTSYSWTFGSGAVPAAQYGIGPYM